MDDRAADPAAAEPLAARPSDASVWLTVAEAAKATKEHPERLRSLARRGKVASRRGNRGTEILVEGGRIRPAEAQPRPPGRADRAADRDPTELTALRDRIGQLEETVAELKDELAEARIAVAQAHGERDVARAIEGELRALLAEARRPWWRRWIG
jgi:chromosome segregation ATPase